MSSNEFLSLGISAPVLKAVQNLGYEQPSPIQAQSIPVLLSGKNLLGTAQTGTGKTAAFALPLLSNIDEKQKTPQILVLTPTGSLRFRLLRHSKVMPNISRVFMYCPSMVVRILADSCVD